MPGDTTDIAQVKLFEYFYIFVPALSIYTALYLFLMNYSFFFKHNVFSKHI